MEIEDDAQWAVRNKAEVYTRGPNATERMVMEARQIVTGSSTQDGNEEN